ncbi:hypothetical protein H6G81_28460 [Scytonema hofmannii FACHB-248]|uniref:Uncharacterized protein n=1 Tax=Scytonema hofmannii FACHB-248 TaxID=1842502 RepID=A0ABR8GZA2_9CYAN|nr:hypothetical protein [Scytonema hofmannii]MBD2608345.1 hypothetical protein [Scytonema hofmannii FACHB-248]
MKAIAIVSPKTSAEKGDYSASRLNQIQIYLRRGCVHLGFLNSLMYCTQLRSAIDDEE